jgi:hypothetical protein
MSVIRTYHDKNNPYTLVANQALFDKTISNAARGLWAQCMARKEDWVFYVSEIINHTTDGKTAIYNQIDELIRAGYVLRLRVKEKKGKKLLFKSVDYIFFESKVDEKKKADFLEDFKKSFPHSGFLDTESPDAENLTLVNNERKQRLTLENTHFEESIPEVVHKSDSYVNSTISTDSIPFQRENQDNTTQPKSEVDYDDPNLHEILSLEPQTIPYFRADILVRWMLKFGSKTLLDTIKFFFQVKATQKKPIPKPEAWMEVALKKKYAEVDKSSQENKRFAENLKKTYNLKSLKINKRYCQDTDTGRDFYYYLPANVFKENLIRTYGVAIP